MTDIKDQHQILCDKDADEICRECVSRIESFGRQYDALVQRLERAEKRDIDRSAILVMIRAAREGDMVKFQRYAEFAAEKTGDERFLAAVKRYFAGDYGNIITAQGTRISE